MPKHWITQWNERNLKVLVLLGMFALTACSPIGLRQSFAPQHDLVRDGGTRLILRATCLPTTPACDLTEQRDATIHTLSQRLTGRTDVNDPVVRADGAEDIIVELPGVTGATQIADITTLLTTSGAVAFLDTGATPLPLGTNIAGKTCISACTVDQYRIVFTGDQIDRGQVTARMDVAQSDKWIVEFAFAGSATQQFAQYTLAHIGQFLTITANDVVINSATIQSEIDGSAEITGMTQPEAKQLAAYLKSGVLPATLSVKSSVLVTSSAG